jgi:GR25 family glycosyltransferase involved in LPS biosynthesis
MAGFNIEIINSGRPKEGWHNLGDVRYFRQFYYAIKNFDFNNDYMLFICGDLSYNNWAGFLNRAIKVLSQYEDVYLYSPHFTNDPWNFDSTNLKVSELDNDLSFATNTNGMMFFMHKEIVKEMLKFFDYFEEKHGWEGMISGWAIDVVHSAITISKNKIILRDSKHLINHPAGSSYDHGKATEESILIYESFNNFNSECSKVVSGIHSRMYRDKSFSSLKDFYAKDFDLKLRPNNIDYHVIYINDERKENRDLIDKVLNGRKHLIKSLNAKDENELNLFYSKNPEFKLSWTEFKPGEIGNFGSHYNAWKYVIENDLDNLLIFEDDCLVDENFIFIYNDLMSLVPIDYDIFSIFIDSNQYPRFKDSDFINNKIAKGYQDWSTLCYAVSQSGAKKLIQEVKDNGMYHPTDWFIFRGGHAGRYNVYSLIPEIRPPVSIDGRYNSQVQ